MKKKHSVLQIVTTDTIVVYKTERNDSDNLCKQTVLEMNLSEI